MVQGTLQGTPPVQGASRVQGAPVISLDPRPSDLCIPMEGLVRDDHME